MNEQPKTLRVIDIENGSVPTIVKALSESLDEVKNLHETLSFMDDVLQRRYLEENTLKQRLEVTQSRLDETQVALASLANSQAVNETCKLREDLETTRQALANSQKWLHEAQHELNVERDNYVTACKVFNDRQRELEAKVKTLECRKCDEVETTNSQFQQENNGLRAGNQILSGENAKLNRHVIRLEGEVRGLSETNTAFLSEVESLNVQVKRLQNTKDFLCRVCKGIMSKRRKLRFENERLHGVIARLQQIIGKLSPWTNS